MYCTSLITGIPRSGTTLCCKLLNQHADSVALHEPIDPSTIPDSCESQIPFENIEVQIKSFKHAIENGLPFNHGDKGGLNIDNPVGQITQQGVRQVVAKRGQIQLQAREEGSFQLIVKQNALFTALLPELSKHYPMVCIVRNPVDVLLSWLTVDLPVNRGHIPAGERFDPQLRHSLQHPDCLTRQLIIYQWFISKFMTTGLPIVRYEDIVNSNGKALDKALSLPPLERETLTIQNRQFSDEVLAQLKNAATGLLNLDCGDLYSTADISAALKLKGL